MLELTVSQIAEICAAKIIGRADFKINKISIDSRNVDEDTLFVPIVGEKYDAHDFIDDLSDKGCKITLTQKDILNPKEDFTYLKVENTIYALQALAKFKRAGIKAPIIAITGSVGKTTTREFVATALESRYEVFKTAGNNNSQIGVPLSIFAIPDSAQMIVLEAGMSEFGEMSRLADIIRPDVAIFTNIGDAHIEQLKTKENIREEKMHLLDKMPEGAVVFLNADNKLLKEANLPKGIKPYYYALSKDSFSGSLKESAAFCAKNILFENGKTEFRAENMLNSEEVPVSLNVYGEHQISNALAALSVANYFKLDLTAAAKRLEEYKGFKHRQEIIEHKGYLLIDDTYNASPDSMKAGINILGGMSACRKIAVLADMKELGEKSKSLHEEIGKYLADKKDISVLFTLGESSLYINEQAKSLNENIIAKHFYNREELNKELKKFIKEKDAILLKGSHSMKLEETVEFLLS